MLHAKQSSMSNSPARTTRQQGPMLLQKQMSRKRQLATRPTTLYITSHTICQNSSRQRRKLRNTCPQPSHNRQHQCASRTQERQHKQSSRMRTQVIRLIRCSILQANRKLFQRSHRTLEHTHHVLVTRPPRILIGREGGRCSRWPAMCTQRQDRPRFRNFQGLQTTRIQRELPDARQQFQLTRHQQRPQPLPQRQGISRRPCNPYMFS